MDYHDLTNVSRHVNYQTFIDTIKPERVFAITTKGQRGYTDVPFEHGDALLFGSETEGLPPQVMNSIKEQNRLKIPMQPNNRSLNLSNSVAIITYEAWRQFNFEGSN